MGRALFFLGIFFLFSCEEEVPPPDFAEEEKLVVNSIISPFLEEVIVEVSVSKNAFGIIGRDLESDIVGDAIVRLSDGTRSILIPFNSERRYYSISTDLFPLHQSEAFRLEVEARGKSVYGETNMPKKVPILSSATLNENVLNVTWRDFLEQGNHYRLVANGKVSGSDFFEPFSFESDEFTSDANRNGQLLSARGKGSEFTDNYEEVIVKIISSSATYSDYFRILNNYVEDDPFADPVQLPSNIVGGIGIFEAVQVSEFTVETR